MEGANEESITGRGVAIDRRGFTLVRMGSKDEVRLVELPTSPISGRFVKE